MATENSINSKFEGDRNLVGAVWSGFPSGLVAVDWEGTIDSLNPAAERIFGYRCDELVGNNFDLLVPAFIDASRHRDDRISEFFKTDAIRPDDAGPCEIVGQHKNGDPIPLEFSVTESGNEENVRFLVVIEDLTDRRTVETEIEDRDRRLAENEFEFRAAEAAIAASARYLAKSELQLGAIIDNVPGAIYRCLPDDGWPVTFISDAIKGITGRPASDYSNRAGHLLDDIVHPADRAEVKAIVRDSVERRQSFELSYRVSRQDGQDRYVREQGQPVYDDDGELLWLAGVIIDVTEQHLAEDALRVSERRYREIFDDSPAPIWEDDWSKIKQWLDEKSIVGPSDARRYFKDHPDDLGSLYDRGVVREISRSGLDLYGATDQEALIEAARSASVSREELEAFQKMLLSFLRGEFQVEGETSDSNLQGTRRIYRYRASIPESHRKEWDRVIYVIEDVTENRQARDELAKLSSALEQSPSAVSIIGLDGAVEYVNKRFQAMTGFDSGQIIGQPSYFWKNSILSESEGEALWRHVVEFGRWDSDFVNQNASGDPYWCRERITAICDANGLRTHFLSNVEDTTEAKAVEAQLFQASKLATLGEMAAGMAHELRQPLNVISMASESALILAEEGGGDREYEHEQFQIILERCGQLSEIIQHLRVFGRKDENEPEIFNPAETLSKAIGLVADMYHLDNIEIDARIPDRCAGIRGHSARLEQVFLNLLGNAHDAIAATLAPAGGTVDGATGRIVVSLVESDAGGDVIVSVSDSGGGIPEDYIDKIFDPFFTTKTVGKGTGLGLSISFGIVTGMGGEIRARNTGDGAEFIVRLPSCADGSDSEQLVDEGGAGDG
jgi:PAS domain S-box-containing protein